jgi:hypothetical protein
MKKLVLLGLALLVSSPVVGQNHIQKGDSLKQLGYLMPALQEYAAAMDQQPSAEISYTLGATSALLWTSQMRDTAFYFLDIALRNDSTLNVLHDPELLSLIEDPRWKRLEDAQIRKYEAKEGPIPNEPYARALFRMIIKDQGFMYAGNIERRKFMKQGGFFQTPAIFPVLAMEEKNKQENEQQLITLLDLYGWPTTTQVTEIAAAGAALIINHASHELRATYFPMLEAAFKKGEAQPLRYAKMKDRLLVEEGKKQRYGTQLQFVNDERVPQPIQDPEYVDQRRAEIGLGPLQDYLKARFNIDWQVPQKKQ